MGTVLMDDQWGWGLSQLWACHLWADDFELFKKAVLASYEKQAASNKHFPMVSASVSIP